MPGCAPGHHFYVNFSLRKQNVYIPKPFVNIILQKTGFPKNPNILIF